MNRFVTAKQRIFADDEDFMDNGRNTMKNQQLKEIFTDDSKSKETNKRKYILMRKAILSEKGLVIEGSPNTKKPKQKQ